MIRPFLPKTTQDAMDAFHAHLDACVRCRERPLDLCPVGAQLLEAFGASATFPTPGTSSRSTRR